MSVVALEGGNILYSSEIASLHKRNNMPMLDVVSIGL